MIDDMTTVERSVFLGQIWPAISRDVEALQSNWKNVRKEGERPLVIHWGDPKTKEVIAIVTADEDGEHYKVASHIAQKYKT